MRHKYTFGPIPSRRLGMSLGIDLVPHKTCSLDCIYCEAGETTQLSLKRDEYVPVAEVIAELESVLSGLPELDYLTFSGAGEPTLNRGIGEIIAFIRTKYPGYRICLLTNGTLLGDPETAAAVRNADLIIPSLDASSEDEFLKINRPAPGLTLQRLIEDLAGFRRSFSGAYWLELFIVPGINDSDASIERFRSIIERINPDKVQLNTLDRPGCVEWLTPAPEATIMRFINRFSDFVPVESVGKFRYRSDLCSMPPPDGIEMRIKEMISRRPATAPDIAGSLAISEAAAGELLEKMSASGTLRKTVSRRGVFYCIH